MAGKKWVRYGRTRVERLHNEGYARSWCSVWYLLPMCRRERTILNYHGMGMLASVTWQFGFLRWTLQVVRSWIQVESEHGTSGEQHA